MKEAFAEDLLREAEKMERFASIERPEQIETSGVTGDCPRAAPAAAARPRRQSPAARPRAPAQPAAQRLRPASHRGELAELDGAADKTQIVDSFAVRPRLQPRAAAQRAGRRQPTGETTTARRRRRGHRAPLAAGECSTGRPQVVIGDEGEGYRAPPSPDRRRRRRPAPSAGQRQCHPRRSDRVDGAPRQPDGATGQRMSAGAGRGRAISAPHDAER